jgi:N6-L-threonylcarbamoyladenine synthase
MITLGIETSCDETSVAIIREREILALKTFSQIDLHKEYGGVVPEIASRSHIEMIRFITNSAINDSGLSLNEIDNIAVTNTPGLIGGLLVGVVFAKSLAFACKKPIIAVNHLEGHMFTTALTAGIEDNFYLLLTSGGHTQMMGVKEYGNYRLFGRTLDDSVGECFDKVGKMMGLDYPAGPKIEQLAKKGNPHRWKFKIPMKSQDNFNFSFSGLKTFFLREYQKIPEPSNEDILDICASLQHIISQILCDRVENMFKVCTDYDKFVLCGGVSANLYLRGKLEELCQKYQKTAFYAPLSLCGDNAAMIAYVGQMRSKKGLFAEISLVP